MDKTCNAKDCNSLCVLRDLHAISNIVSGLLLHNPAYFRSAWHAQQLIALEIAATQSTNVHSPAQHSTAQHRTAQYYSANFSTAGQNCILCPTSNMLQNKPCHAGHANIVQNRTALALRKVHTAWYKPWSPLMDQQTQCIARQHVMHKDLDAITDCTCFTPGSASKSTYKALSRLLYQLG